MKTELIRIANLKCGGCETTIKNKLSQVDGVMQVVISHDEDLVTIVHSGKPKRAEFITILEHLGYPEATAENGLLMKLKSYASCVAGRLKNAG